MKKVSLILGAVVITAMMLSFSSVGSFQIEDELIKKGDSQIVNKKLNNDFEFEGVIIYEGMSEYGTYITVNVTKGKMTGQTIELIFHDGNYCEDCENYFNEGYKGDFEILGDGDDGENIGRKVKGVYKEGKCFQEDGETGNTFETTCYRPIQLNYN